MFPLRPNSEKELLKAVKSGDRKAFDQLFHYYAPVVYPVLLKMVRAEETAAELLQDTFVRVWDARHRINTELSAKAYIFTIARNEAYLEIASLSAASQTELFGQHWHNWKEVQQFNVGNLNYMLSRYRYDLKKAPFDTKDKKLIKEVGACTNCSFNSATLKTLFPELASQAICTKKNCYQSKCDAQFITVVNAAIQEQQPEAVIFEWSFPETLLPVLESLPLIGELKRYKKNDITIIETPVMPAKDDFMVSQNDEAAYYDDEDGEDMDYIDEPDDMEQEHTDTEAVFDEGAYNAALSEYYEDLEEYNRQIECGELPKGLFVSTNAAAIVLFSVRPVYQQATAQKGITAKEVQEALKAGKATPELLQSEIERIESREARAKELDGEKVHLIVHSTFMEHTKDVQHVSGLTAADLVAARLLVYQSLDYSARRDVTVTLFDPKKAENAQAPSLYEQLEQLTEQEYAYLIRMAVGSQPEAKFPNNDTGKTLYKVAAEAGIDVAQIEQQQHDKAETRADKLAVRKAELEKKIDKLNRTAGLSI